MTEPLDPDETADLAANEPPDSSPQRWPAQVNLLPPSFVAEQRQRMIAVAAGVILIAYLAGLGGLYAYKVTKVDDAQAARDTVQRDVTGLQADVDALQEYQTLVTERDAREALLTTAMDGELSWARVFGDMALAFSRQASLTGVTATIPEDDESAAGVVVGEDGATEAPTAADADADPNVPVAAVTFTGYSVDRFAPGVQEVLHEFGDVSGFFDSYLSLASDEERGSTDVTTFEGRFKLNGQAYTHRFDDGLPEESLP